jgi:P4 family phage/plasmid primase-like protien
MKVDNESHGVKRPSTDSVDFGDIETKVADISVARARRGASGGKDKRSTEARFADHLRCRDDIAIAGRTQDRSIDLSMYRWVRTHWRLLEDAEAHQEFYSWARDMAPDKLTARCAASAVETASELLLDGHEHDLSKMRGPGVVIPTPDGYLRLDDDGTVRVLNIRRADGITYCVPARIDTSRVWDGKYDPAPVPSDSALGRYLDRFFPDREVRNLLQEACASTLLPCCFERAVVLVGSGANGKSTLIHLLRALHPEHASLRLDQIRGRFGLQEVAGRTLLIASETPSYLGDDIEQALKSLISRDPITVEKKNKTSRTITPRATLVIASNAPLRFTDRTYGAERKYLHIPFSVRLADNDPARIPDYHRLITDDPAEMSALLDWLLAGARRLLARGRFPDPPAAVQQLVQEQKMQTDTVFAWLIDYDVQATSNYLTPKHDIYAHYRDAVLGGSGKPVGDKIFWTRLREHFGASLVESRSRGADGRERIVTITVPGLRTGHVVV